MADVEKVVLKPMKYVDGVPVEGQSRIDWIQNGEYFGGATSPVTNEGELNRATVKVQKNIVDMFDNITETSGVVNQLVELVNLHQTIINPAGSGDDLFARMNAAEFQLNTNDQNITGLKQADITFTNSIIGIRNDIGLVDPDKTYRTVRDELYHIKGMVGNYQDFDQDGNADLNAIGRGVKGQVERNLKAITGHETRIQSLEKWWDGKTPDTLIADVSKIRTELGTTPTAEPVYTRLDALEHTVGGETGLAETVRKLVESTNLVGFPISYTDVGGVQTSKTGLWNYVYAVKGDVNTLKTQIGEVALDLSGVKLALGTNTDEPNSGTVWGVVNEVKATSENLETIIGATETDGMQGRMNAIDVREQSHYDRLDGITNSLSTTVFNEHQTDINQIKTELMTGEDNIKELVRGVVGGEINQYETFGAFEASRQMFINMYTPYIQGGGGVLNPLDKNDKATFVRIYDSVNDSWVWVDQVGRDYVLTVGKSIKSNNGSKGVEFVDAGNGKENISLGSADVGVAFAGDVVGKLPLATGAVVEIGDETVLAKTETGTDLGSGKKVRVNVETSDSAKVLVGGNEYTILTTDNAKRLMDLQDPRQGVDLVGTAAIKSGGYDLAKRGLEGVLIGNDFDTTKFVGKVNQLVMNDSAPIKFALGGVNYEGIKLVEVNADKVFMIGSGNASVGLKLNNDDMRSARVVGATNSYTIWHDGIDAPKDGAFYARQNGQWVGFSTGGSGSGIGEEAPDNGQQYTRVSESGVGRWELVGAKTIALASAMKITGAVTGGAIDLIKFANDKTIQIGVDSSNTILNGVVGRFKSSTGFIMEDGKNGVVYNKAVGSFLFGDQTTKNILQGSSFVKVGTDEFRVWHDGIDAASDDQYYARRNGQWQKVFNGVNPDADVLINQTSAYRVSGHKVVSGRVIGQDFITTIGQADTWVEFAGKVLPFSLPTNVVNQTSSIGVTTTIGTQINVIGTGHDFTRQDYVKVGDVSARLDLFGTEGFLNGKRLMTTSDDAPVDDVMYTRRNNKWEKAYHYGDFAVDAPTNPKEGDLFFEFIN